MHRPLMLIPSLWALAQIGCFTLLGITSGCRRAAPPMPAPSVARISIGGDAPLHEARLAGARLESIQSTTTWELTDTRFTVANRGSALPANVAASLLGPGRSADRIVGDWRFDEGAGVMILSNLECDGQNVSAPASLPIHAAGAVRVDFGVEQYNLLLRADVERLSRSAIPPALGR